VILITGPVSDITSRPIDFCNRTGGSYGISK
jgi:hypothetical protein